MKLKLLSSFSSAQGHKFMDNLWLYGGKAHMPALPASVHTQVPPLASCSFVAGLLSAEWRLFVLP